LLQYSLNQIPIQPITNFNDLVATPFKDSENFLCWQRSLSGDYHEIIQQCISTENITIIDPEQLLNLNLSAAGQLARNIILNDFQLLTDYGAAPTLNIIKQYDRDSTENIFPTDVYSFHIDRSPVPVDTFLCTYYGATTEILPNAQSIQKIQIPEIRNQLKNNFQGTDAAFEIYLTEHFYDLHYTALPNTQPIQIALGHICRLAVDHPGSPTLPCIHRAPLEIAGEYRLLLIC
jgi:hypothetical protein